MKTHRTFTDHCKEWLDTLVVAISVAMAFRAYFYEPFRIPTGSMQTTLWGYHTEANVEKGAWDTFPLCWLKWAWTGSRTIDLDAPISGTVHCDVKRGDGFADIYQVSLSGRTVRAGSLPTDACRELEGRFIEKGKTIWKGSVTTGDFIFVNRWKWNFFQPKVNDVMIFSTTGIPQLPQGTHYIKRMKARPGEKYVLEHPVAGRPTAVEMGPDEFFACGDNYNNSFDSRYWGTVPRANLRGEGSFVFWPFNGWRIIR